ncbi:hypothetical protein [Shewanella litorisediminis]|uniref:Lipoprotein n=1 Tax=Shewanella litorisediminis TaxID=1173586 RepID=A0ABX7G0K7_9GAMM|nr:hypothetical protein [Shewanella litorisediminis]MCL2918136.1 hypothetical protein [Shewanella litorisediminis]QRH00807.1 hypothetical protein JQC75_13085 [Shewanella litorisediminis]
MRLLPVTLATALTLLLTACSANQVNQSGCAFVTGIYENDNQNRSNPDHRETTAKENAGVGVINALFAGIAGLFKDEHKEENCL